MSHRIQLRRDKAAFWAQENPVLAQGELAWVSDTGELKIGDGVTPFNELSNILGGDGPGGSSEILVFDTANDLWNDPDFENYPEGQLFLIRDFASEQSNSGGALLRMENGDTNPVVVGIPAENGQFRAQEWFYDDTNSLPEYTLAASASMTVALPSNQIFFEEVGGQIRIYFPSDTLEERQAGSGSKSQYLLIALSDMSKASIVTIGGSSFVGGDKNYQQIISSNAGSVVPIDSDTPLLDIQDILNGVHDADTFIIGNAARVSSTAQFEQDNTTELSVSGTLQNNKFNLTVTDPGAGKIAFDSFDLTKVTRLVLSKTAATAQEVLDWITTEDPTPDFGDRLLVMDFTDRNAQSFVFKLGNFFDDNGDFVSIDAQYVGNNDGESPITILADEVVELYLLHSPFVAQIDLSNFLTQQDLDDAVAPLAVIPKPLSVPIGFPAEVTHTGTGWEPFSQLGAIPADVVTQLNAGTSMVLEINLDYYIKPNGTQPLVRLKMGNIEVKLPSGNIPGVDSFLYFHGIVTLFISKPGSDLQIKAMTRFRSYESFAGGGLQDDLIHFPGDYLGNDEYTVTGGLATDGAWEATDPWIQFNADLGIKARLEKVSGQYSLAF